MHLLKREMNGLPIVDVSGRITLGEGCEKLRGLVRELLEQGHHNWILNLADCTYMDSSGTGELVSALMATENRGGKLKLLKLTKKIHDLLQITKFRSLFEVYDDEDRAIASFRQTA
ncbi:MAG: STAS domain-containing protein [Minisyncoccia bacterium]|jgi:anti-sigma B factor antagonist